MKNKRKWILGGIAATLLVIALVLGSSTSYLGAFKLQTSKNTSAVKSTTSTTSQYDLSIDEVHISDTSSSGVSYLVATKCNNSTSSASTPGQVAIKIEANGQSNELGRWTPSKNGTCETQQIMTEFPDISLGTFIHGETYSVAVTIDSTNLVAESDESNNTFTFSYTYTGETMKSFTLDDISISDDYGTLSASVCRIYTRAKETTADVNFTVDGETKTVTADLPSSANGCEIASVDMSEFNIMTPAGSHVVTVDSDVADASATSTVTISPDIEVRDAGLDGNELYAEVCGVGTAGDEIGTVRFSIATSDGNGETLVEDKYAGIGTMPTRGTCKTVTVTLSNAEMGSIIQGGSYLDAFVEFTTGFVSEENDMNNHFLSFF